MEDLCLSPKTLFDKHRTLILGLSYIVRIEILSIKNGIDDVGYLLS